MRPCGVDENRNITLRTGQQQTQRQQFDAEKSSRSHLYSKPAAQPAAGEETKGREPHWHSWLRAAHKKRLNWEEKRQHLSGCSTSSSSKKQHSNPGTGGRSAYGWRRKV